MNSTTRLSFRPFATLSDRAVDLENLPRRRLPSSAVEVFGRVSRPSGSRSALPAEHNPADSWHAPTLGELLLSGGITLRQAEVLMRRAPKLALAQSNGRGAPPSSFRDGPSFLQPHCAAMTGTLIAVVVLFTGLLLTA